MAVNSVADAVAALERGQQFEARGTPADLTQALQCYDEAIARLELLARNGGNREAAHHLGIAWMNRGSVLLRAGSPAALDDAVRAYERAIACLEPAVDPAHPVVSNSLGAAWMNRGLILHRIGSPDSLPEAEKSLRQSISVLSNLVDGENPWPVRNLAGACLNLANLLLDLRRFPEARTVAVEAMSGLVDTEKTDLGSADLTLKARRAWCDALGQLLAQPPPGTDRETLATEASDAVDDALALIRYWQAQDPRLTSELAVRFFRFGVQLYRFHQPHFLAEFVLENLGTSPPSRTAEFHTIAADAVTAALGDLRPPAFLSTTNPAHARLVETSRSLVEVQARLQQLRPPASSTHG